MEATGEPGEIVTPDPLDPWVSESHRVQHPARELRHAGSGVSLPRFQRNRLGYQATQSIDVKDPVQLASEAGRAGSEKKWILKPAAEQLSREIRAGHWGSGTLDPPEEG
jgi:hypothetical protein